MMHKLIMVVISLSFFSLSNFDENSDSIVESLSSKLIESILFFYHINGITIFKSFLKSVILNFNSI